MTGFQDQIPNMIIKLLLQENVQQSLVHHTLVKPKYLTVKKWENTVN